MFHSGFGLVRTISLKFKGVRLVKGFDFDDKKTFVNCWKKYTIIARFKIKDRDQFYYSPKTFLSNPLICEVHVQRR